MSHPIDTHLLGHWFWNISQDNQIKEQLWK